MNKILINILLFSTLVIGSIGLITFDVWADTQTTDIYEIPDDYKNSNMYVEFYRNLDEYYFETYEYDFDVYVPDGYNYVFAYYHSVPSSWYVMNPYLIIYSDTGYVLYNFLEELSFDDNNVAKYTTGNLREYGKSTYINDSGVDIYIKNNGSMYHKIGRKLKKNDVLTTSCIESYITISSLYRRYIMYGSKDYYSVMFNQPVVYFGSGYPYPTIKTTTYIFTTSELQKDVCPVSEYEYSVSNTDDMRDVINYVDKLKSKGNITTFPEPELLSAKFNSDTNQVRLSYVRNKDCLPNDVQVNNKLFIKVQGQKEWQTIDNLYEEEKLVTLVNNNSYKLIIGALNVDKLFEKLGYDYSDDSENKPIIEAVIWGVRYGYRVKSPDYKYTNWVFSRYVFEDNIITDTDVKIDDLGNLTDIKQPSSGSSSGVTVKPGGAENNPTISGTDEADYSDLGSFLKSFNFDFSSIGNAISGSFSLVTGFASMIGNIFQNFFGDAVGVIALLAIGICVVLRVLGR